MKKKLLATLIAGAVLSTGIIGLTACNTPGNGDNNGDGSGTGTGNGEEVITVVKGAQVDAEGWAKAIDATIDADNYTLKGYTDNEARLTGSYGEVSNVDITAKSVINVNYYFNNDNSSYGVETVKTTMSGVPDELKDEDDLQDEDYTSEYYSVKDGEKYYEAAYYGYRENAKWTVNETSSFYGDEYMPYSSIIEATFATEKEGTPVDLTELYESFTYADGVYTATSLWQYGEEASVSLSIKDGYVVSISCEYYAEGKDGDSIMSNKIKALYNLSDYGTTTVTPSDAAKKAVEDYKAEQVSETITSVAGKTFVFSGLVFEYDDSITDEMKTAMEAMKPMLEAGYASYTLTFGNNGDFSMSMVVDNQSHTAAGTYTENDNVIVLTPVTADGEPVTGDSTPQSMTLSDSKLITVLNEESGITVKLVLSVQA